MLSQHLVFFVFEKIAQPRSCGYGKRGKQSCPSSNLPRLRGPANLGLQGGADLQQIVEGQGA